MMLCYVYTGVGASSSKRQSALSYLTAETTSAQRRDVIVVTWPRRDVTVVASTCHI